MQWEEKYSWLTARMCRSIWKSADDARIPPDILEHRDMLAMLFGQAQMGAGADALTFPYYTTGDLVSGEYYRRFCGMFTREWRNGCLRR